MRRSMQGAILAIIVIVACVITLTYYHASSSNVTPNTTTITASRKPSHLSNYSISVYYGNKLIKKLTLSDLHKLKNYMFVDSRGHEQEGPSLYDVIKYALGNKTFKYVIVKGQRGNPEENLTYSIISNPRNYIILDYTKRGTVKLCGNENVLPYSKWVKDVTEIIVKG